jgi:hypothetical protein
MEIVVLILRVSCVTRPLMYLNKKIVRSRHADGLEQTHLEEACT